MDEQDSGARRPRGQERKKASRGQAKSKAGANATPQELAKVEAFPAKKSERTKDPDRSNSRRTISIAASILFGVVAVGALSATTVGATLVDLPAPAKPLPGVMQTIPAGVVTAVCPAAPQLLNSALDDTDAQFVPGSSTASTNIYGTLMSELSGAFPETAVTSVDGTDVVSQVEAAPENAEDQDASQTQSDSGFTNLSAKLFRGVDSPEVSVVKASPTGAQSALVSSMKAYSATDGDLQGIAAQNCTSPSNDQWLVGASTNVGVTSVLSVSNPSQTAATVNLNLYGSEGPIEAAGARGILVAPGQTESIVLAGLASNQPDLAIQVQSTGAAVSASIQTSTLRGLTPGGVDYIAPSAGPSLTKVLAGIRVPNANLLDEVQSTTGDEEASNAIFVSAVGATDASVTVTLTGLRGEVDFPGSGTVTVPAGTVTEIPLENVAAGNYSVSLESDGLIVAGARVLALTEADGPLDLAYLSDSPQLGSQQLLNLPEGLDARLYFSSGDASSDIRMTPVDGNGQLGEEQTMTTAANSTLEVDPARLGTGTVAVLISASGAPSYGSMTLGAGNRAAIAVVPILPVAGGTQQVPLDIAP